MSEENHGWILDCVFSFIKSPAWAAEVTSFIDEHCIVFGIGEENSFVYTTLHEEFRKIIENVLIRHLNDFGISQESFIEACLSNEKEIELADKLVYRQIFALEDFLIFKEMMITKNIDLELEAIEKLKREKSKKAHTTLPINMSDDIEDRLSSEMKPMPTGNVGEIIFDPERVARCNQVEKCQKEKDDLPIEQKKKEFPKKPNHQKFIKHIIERNPTSLNNTLSIDNSRRMKGENITQSNTTSSNVKTNCEADDVTRARKKNEIGRYVIKKTQIKDLNKTANYCTCKFKEQHSKFQKKLMKEKIKREKEKSREEAIDIRQQYLNEQRYLLNEKKKSMKTIIEQERKIEEDNSFQSIKNDVKNIVGNIDDNNNKKKHILSLLLASGFR